MKIILSQPQLFWAIQRAFGKSIEEIKIEGDTTVYRKKPASRPFHEQIELRMDELLARFSPDESLPRYSHERHSKYAQVESVLQLFRDMNLGYIDIVTSNWIAEHWAFFISFVKNKGRIPKIEFYKNNFNLPKLS